MKKAKPAGPAKKPVPIRRAFTLRLKPGAFEKYKFFHDNIWPELVREIEACGIAQITTFENDLQLFLYSEIHNEQAWDDLWSSKAHDKWAGEMRPLMRFRPDGKLDSGPLREIFHLATAAGATAKQKKAGSKPRITAKVKAKAESK